ncbi:hypothetical protein GCM10009851_29640 [Herbiconiux moechotypicola]|uniref:GtrA/DPMS transmembrane domain-containing protein n=2 Tax=Herbiconiux moechotypicola TaxID=637393 RepID=A0ABN3DVA7_9MICO
MVGDRRVAFLAVGAANTAVGFVAFVAADLTVGSIVDAAVNETAGSLATLGCAHVVGVLFAFAMYRRFVFRVRGGVWRDLVRFEGVYLVAIGVNAVALPLLVGLGWPRIPAQLSILTVTVVLSWFGHSHVSFRRSGD